jgi:hypothetical protein
MKHKTGTAWGSVTGGETDAQATFGLVTDFSKQLKKDALFIKHLFCYKIYDFL